MTLVYPVNTFQNTLFGPFILMRDYPVKIALNNTGNSNAKITYVTMGDGNIIGPETVPSSAAYIRQLPSIHSFSIDTTSGTSLSMEIVTMDEDIDPKYISTTLTQTSPIPAPASYSLDGSVTNKIASSTTLSLSLTTSKTNDIIIVGVTTGSPLHTVTGIADTSLLTWTKITNVIGVNNDTEMWWAPSTGALASDSITITISSADNITATAFGVNGSTAISKPFDSNTSLPATNNGSSNNPTSGNFTVNGSTAFVIALMGCVDSPSVTDPVGYTNIGTNSFPTNDVSFAIVSGTGGSTILSWVLSSSQTWQTIVAVIG